MCLGEVAHWICLGQCNPIQHRPRPSIPPNPEPLSLAKVDLKPVDSHPESQSLQTLCEMLTVSPNLPEAEIYTDSTSSHGDG